MMHLWRVGLLVLGLAVLTACGGSAPAVPTPHNKIDGNSVSDPAVQAVVTDWKADAKDGLIVGTIKAETIIEESYQSSSTLEEITEYYNKALGNDGWIFRQRTPGAQDGFFLGAYEHGTTTLVIGVIDLRKFAGTGTYVYLVHGTK